VGDGQICIVALGASRAGGAEVYTFQLIKELSSRGYPVKLVCHDADAEVEALCNVERFGRPSSHWMPGAWRIGGLHDLVAYRKDARRLSNEQPSLIIASAQYLSWAYSKRFSSAPVVYVPHSVVAAQEVHGYPWDSPIQRFVSTKVIDYLECWLLQHAVRTIRFTQGGCQELLKRYGGRVKPRFAVFPPAVPLPLHPSERQSKGPVRLLFVGRLVQSKNMDFLLYALSQIQDLDWQLNVVGDGPEKMRLESLTKQYGLTDRVAFHGYCANVSMWYMDTDMLTFPSRLESLGLVILEAMSFGVPAITIRTNGRDYLNSFHEFITDGENGFIADDERSFVSKLADLIHDRNVLAEIGARARRKVEEQHSWDHHIRCYETLFSHVLGGRSRS
jgi:glycosyltransferase involved in cell wall biosynthesis